MFTIQQKEAAYIIAFMLGYVLLNSVLRLFGLGSLIGGNEHLGELVLWTIGSAAILCYAGLTIEALFRSNESMVQFRNKLTFLVISLYMILNYGFMQVRLPPVSGGGVPIGEIALLSYLTSINYNRVLARMGQVVWLFPFFLWWGYGSIHAAVGFSMHGFWALRDATHFIESMFILVGFAFAARATNIDWVFKWIPQLLLIGCVYSLGFPFKETLANFSPMLMGGAGNPVPLLFNFTNSSLILLSAMAYVAIFHNMFNRAGRKYLISVGLLLAYMLTIFQARHIYLQLAAMVMFLALHRRGILTKAFLAIGIFLVAFGIWSVLGIEVEGRVGHAFSLEFLWRHILTIFGISSEGLEGVAGGFDQRIEWWTTLYYRWSSNIFSVFLGLGFGEPLIDYIVAGGVPVREPHNSFISLVARLGFIGFACFVMVHGAMIATWHRTYLWCKKRRWREGENRLLFLMAFFVLVWVLCIGEDGFEKPFIAIPYYFFWGLILRFSWHVKKGHIDPTAQDQVNSIPDLTTHATSSETQAAHEHTTEHTRRP